MARGDPQILLRVSPEIKAKLQSLAEWNKRSVNAEIIALIESGLADAEYKKDNEMKLFKHLVENRQDGNPSTTKQSGSIELSEDLTQELLRQFKKQGLI